MIFLDHSELVIHVSFSIDSIITTRMWRGTETQRHFLGIADRCLLSRKVLEDFVEGTNLSDLLTDSSRPVPIPKLKTITSGILTALDFLHEHFVCHKG